MAPAAMGSGCELMGRFVRSVGAGEPGPRRVRLVAHGLVAALGEEQSLPTHCEVAAMLAGRAGLEQPVVEALAHAYERWDGEGSRPGSKARRSRSPSRVAAVARDADLAARRGEDPGAWLRGRRSRAYERCRPLASVAPAAASHHERLDASGYHRSLDAATLSREERILAAADVFAALAAERPHRPAFDDEDAAGTLESEAAAGRLDADAVACVLPAAGRRPPTRTPAWPRDLSDREVEVVRLLARGRSNREVAGRLVISPKTVGRHLPPGASSGQPAYGALVEALGDDVQAVAKELELYAGGEPPPGYGLGTEVAAVVRTADARGFMDAFVSLELRPGVPPPAPAPGPPPPWATRPAGIRALTQAFRAYDLPPEALRRFDRPVYYALGALSNPDVYEAIATRLAGVFADFTLEVFEERHHFEPPHRFEPERLARSLRARWARAEGRAGAAPARAGTPPREA